MNDNAVDRVYEKIKDVITGEDYDTIMVVLGALHNELALQFTQDEDKLRALYAMMADAAVCMAILENDNYPELQTETNPKQKKTAQKARKTSRNGPKPFGPH